MRDLLIPHIFHIFKFHLSSSCLGGDSYLRTACFLKCYGDDKKPIPQIVDPNVQTLSNIVKYKFLFQCRWKSKFPTK